jgi:hypothetical protein
VSSHSDPRPAIDCLLPSPPLPPQVLVSGQTTTLWDPLSGAWLASEVVGAIRTVQLPCSETSSRRPPPPSPRAIRPLPPGGLHVRQLLQPAHRCVESHGRLRLACRHNAQDVCAGAWVVFLTVYRDAPSHALAVSISRLLPPSFPAASRTLTLPSGSSGSSPTRRASLSTPARSSRSRGPSSARTIFRRAFCSTRQLCRAFRPSKSRRRIRMTPLATLQARRRQARRLLLAALPRRTTRLVSRAGGGSGSNRGREDPPACAFPLHMPRSPPPPPPLPSFQARSQWLRRTPAASRPTSRGMRGGALS